MYVIREVMHCKPGKVRDMVDSFKAVSALLEGMGHPPLRILTDVTGERFWTVQAEQQAETLDGLFDLRSQLRERVEFGEAMSGYHDVIEWGRREIYRLED